MDTFCKTTNASPALDAFPTAQCASVASASSVRMDTNSTATNVSRSATVAATSHTAANAIATRARAASMATTGRTTSARMRTFKFMPADTVKKFISRKRRKTTARAIRDAAWV
ncbi:hypothetical protein BSKO_12436 [Bryopsis sp. KO-2023]|nr:hypothetical protein BSKO_12436 [Bryopsis sp. KO-2023]